MIVSRSDSVGATLKAQAAVLAIKAVNLELKVEWKWVQLQE